MTRIIALVLCSLSLALASVAQAATVSFVSVLNGLSSVPANASAATGTATMSFDDVSNLFDLSINVIGLNKASLTNSHIHLGAAGVNGGVLVGLGTGLSPNWTDTTTGMSLALTGQAFPAANVADLLAGNTYLNLHTAAFSAGEIRGQLTPVPVPAAVWLLGSGLIALLGAARAKL